MEDSARYSFLAPLGYSARDRCGYCKSSARKGIHIENRRNNASAVYGVRINDVLQPEHYQSLVDRGWRRSGSFLYLPDVLRSCCPHHTIRLPAATFKPRRDQRQAVNRWNTHVLGSDYIKEAARLYPKSRAEKKTANSTFDLLTVIHASEQPQILQPPHPTHNFTVTLEHDSFTEEKYRLFAAYQQHVHGDAPWETTRAQFRSFLCDSPVVRRENTAFGANEAGDERIGADISVPRLLGSYHHLYRLNGRLIAMSVLDLLPHAVSGVYFMYDQEFEKWSFGKLSALREIALAAEYGYAWYYMGYWIPGCPKMDYKLDYHGQEVLDLGSGEGEWCEIGEWRKEREAKDAEGVANNGTAEGRGKGGESGMDAVQERERKKDGTALEAEEENDGDATIPDIFTHNTLQERSADLSHARPELIESVLYGTGASLLDIPFDGMIPREEVERRIDLGKIVVRSKRRGITLRCENIIGWENMEVGSGSGIKGLVAELAACVGEEVARGMVVDLG